MRARGRRGEADDALPELQSEREEKEAEAARVHRARAGRRSCAGGRQGHVSATRGADLIYDERRASERGRRPTLNADTSQRHAADNLPAAPSVDICSSSTAQH